MLSGAGENQLVVLLWVMLIFIVLVLLLKCCNGLREQRGSRDSSVLYDVPGPKAIARNPHPRRDHGAPGARRHRPGDLAIRVTGQFTAKKWELLHLLDLGPLRRGHPEHVAACRGRAGLGARRLLALGRLSDHAWVRVLVGWIIDPPRHPGADLHDAALLRLPVVGIKMQPYWWSSSPSSPTTARCSPR